MSLTNSPDPALREAVVQQDLANVLHPIVQHKTLEAKISAFLKTEDAILYSSCFDANAGFFEAMVPRRKHRFDYRLAVGWLGGGDGGNPGPRRIMPAGPVIAVRTYIGLARSRRLPADHTYLHRSR